MSAEEVYIDPSALVPFYVHDQNSRELAMWRHRIKGAFPVTHHGRMEVINSIGLALFQKRISPEAASDAWGFFENDFEEGRLAKVDVLWRAALKNAAELSRVHTVVLGTRSLDVLHVACARELGLRHFLSFDHRQQELATKLGLKLVAL